MEMQEHDSKTSCRFFPPRQETKRWPLAVVGKSKWYCTIETDLKKPCDVSNSHNTYLEPKFFVPGNGGDVTRLRNSVDCGQRMTYGLAIDNFDLTPTKELSVFRKKKRRRNKRVQLEGRKFTTDLKQACEFVYFVSL